MTKTIVVLVLIIAVLVFYIGYDLSTEDEVEVVVDTVYSKPDTIYAEAKIKYVDIIRHDTLFCYDTLIVRDTVIVDKIAYIDTTFDDGAAIGVEYSYYKELFDISYMPAPSIKKTIIYDTKNKWWERFGIGVGIGTNFKDVSLQLQLGYYFTLSDL